MPTVLRGNRGDGTAVGNVARLRTIRTFNVDNISFYEPKISCDWVIYEYVWQVTCITLSPPPEQRRKVGLGNSSMPRHELVASHIANHFIAAKDATPSHTIRFQEALLGRRGGLVRRQDNQVTVSTINVFGFQVPDVFDSKFADEYDHSRAITCRQQVSALCKCVCQRCIVCHDHIVKAPIGEHFPHCLANLCPFPFFFK